MVPNRAKVPLAKYMVRRSGTPSQIWRTFLRNHAEGVAAIDMFVMASAPFQLLYVMIILARDRRKIMRTAVTEHQNADVERVIGSIRGGCLDRIVIFNERHLRRVRSSYIDDYQRTRTHLSIDRDYPDPRPIQPPRIGRAVVQGSMYRRVFRSRSGVSRLWIRSQPVLFRRFNSIPILAAPQIPAQTEFLVETGQTGIGFSKGCLHRRGIGGEEHCLAATN